MNANLRKKAKTILKEVKGLPFKVENFDYLDKKCAEVPSMARKLTNISRNKYYRKLKFKNIQNLVKDYNLDLELNEQEKNIKLPHYKSIWDLP